MKSNRVVRVVSIILVFMLLPTLGVFPSVVYGATQTELITNGGFESGLNGWNVIGDFHADPGFPYYHSGARYAYLSTPTGNPGNNLIGNMYQTVSIPSSVTSATLTFWYNITTNEIESTSYDVLNVKIQNSAGAYLSTVASWSNLDSQPIGIYGQKSFDLTSYIGQTIRINFLGTTDGSLPTVFRIDDVSILAISPEPTRVIGLNGDMNFGSVQVSSSSTRTLTVSNTGTSTLNVSSISYPSGFSGNWSNGSISANGGSQAVTVTFTPTAATTYSGTITVNSDKTGGTNTIACSGTGTFANQPPTLALTGPSSDITVDQGDTVTIQWTDSDPDDNAYISLARDADCSEGGHTWLTVSLREDPDGSSDLYYWDTSGVPAGTYHIWGMIYDGTNPEVYSCAPGRVTLRLITDDHPEWPDATPISVPSTTSGIIDPQGDRDWFKFPVEGGCEYRTRIVAGTLTEGYVRVYRQNGDEIGSSVTGDFSWTAPATEDNYVEVWGPGLSTGTYQLEITGGCNTPPTLTLTEPSSDITVDEGDTVTIQWTDSDPDDNAYISLARDSDCLEGGHTWLTVSLREDPDGSSDLYYWDTSGVPAGTYRIWGMIYDGTNPEEYSCAPGSVTIGEETISTPNTPSGPSDGDIGESLTYSTGGASSSEGHSIQYHFDWGDGSYSDSLAPRLEAVLSARLTAS